MSDEFDNLFVHRPDLDLNAPLPSPVQEEKPAENTASEELEEFDGPLFPKLNALQIVLVIAIVLSLGGFGIFYTHRSSAQNNSSSSSLTPIPTQSDDSLSTPSQSTESAPSQDASTQQSGPQTEGGQPVTATPTPIPTTKPTATPTPTAAPTTQPTPTATSAPTPTSAPTSTPTPTPTGVPTDTPTPPTPTP